MSAIHLRYEVPGDDFTRAGEASGAVKKRLKALGYNPDAIRRFFNGYCFVMPLFRNVN